MITSLARSGNHYISTIRVSMFTKLGRMVIYLDGLVPITTHDCLITWSCKITWQTKTIISPSTVPMVTKLGRMVVYLGGLLTIIKSYNDLITWSCKVTWQTKTISTLPEWLWPSNLARWWNTTKTFHSKSYLIFQSHGFVRSRDILSTLYLHFRKTSGHEA